MRKEEVDLDRRSFIAGLGTTFALLSLSDAGCSQRQDQTSTGRIAQLRDLDESTHFDVCIIGSGFAGAVLAESLVGQGAKVVVLESGFASDRPPTDSRYGQLEVFRNSGPLEYPVARTRFRGIGGTSWLWGGFCARMQPIDIETNAYTPPGAAWPLRYADLEPYYELAERTLAVGGSRESAYHPPRRSAYPITREVADQFVTSVSQTAGIVTSTQARCIPPVRVANSQIPRILASATGAVVQGGTVTRLLAADGGGIIGAEVKDFDRNVKVVRAVVYIVACGGLESPRLLLLSRTPEFQNGIGNNHDLVGRCFMEHRNMGFSGHVKVGWSDLVRERSFNISYQFHREFKNAGLGGIQLTLRLSALRRGDVLDGDVIKSFGKLVAPGLDIGAGLEMEPSPQNRVTLDSELKDYFGNPVANLYLSESERDIKTRERARQLILKIYGMLNAQNVTESESNWAHHHMGTCRMGEDPRTSVVDANLRVHGTRNLFVAGSAVFVTSGCAGPTVTLTALSHRLAEHIHSQLRAGSFSV